MLGASGKWLERGVPVLRAIDCRKAVEERALAPQSINLIVKRRCALVGLDATEFAAHGLKSAYLTGLRAGAPVASTMQQWQRRSVQQVPGYKSEVDPGRREGQPTHAIGEVRLIRAVVVS